MISEKLVKALNDQLNAELYSAYLYLSMSGYLSSADWAGAAVWMRVQAKEESKHAMKFYDYIVEQGARVRLKEVKCPPGQWDSLLAVFEQTCKHERKVTSMIESLMELAKKAKDKETQEFLQWFVDEQVEEEEHTGNVLEQVKAAGDALAKLDTELGKRKE